MKNILLSFSLCLILISLNSCSSDHYHSQTIVNNSDYDITFHFEERIRQTDIFTVDSNDFTVSSKTEFTYKEETWSESYDVVCAPLISESVTITTADSLTLTKDILSYHNWEESNAGSTNRHKMQICRFLIENSDME